MQYKLVFFLFDLLSSFCFPVFFLLDSSFLACILVFFVACFVALFLANFLACFLASFYTVKNYLLNDIVFVFWDAVV